MTQKQIRRRREAIEANISELGMQVGRLREELWKLQYKCLHCNKRKDPSFNPKRGGFREKCVDCGEPFSYKEGTNREPVDFSMCM